MSEIHKGTSRKMNSKTEAEERHRDGDLWTTRGENMQEEAGL